MIKLTSYRALNYAVLAANGLLFAYDLQGLAADPLEADRVELIQPLASSATGALISSPVSTIQCGPTGA